ncbi:MAG: hypothetical protein K2L07_15425 [Lachnospiraceae bacterium]|nr:hypothetical protein [Lachnospiraceae bacterium]
MSILSGYGKFKRYVLTDSGYKLCSQWTSSNTVHFDDGKTAQTKLGAISGITDSLTATNSNIALSAVAGKNLQDQLTALNTGIKDKMYSAGTSKPISGYTVHDDSYLQRSPFGQIDFYIHITASVIQNQSHIIGYVGVGYRPSNPREVYCTLSNIDGTNLLHVNGAIYPTGEIKVFSPLQTDSYIVYMIGSYFVG